MRWIDDYSAVDLLEFNLGTSLASQSSSWVYGTVVLEFVIFHLL